MGKPRPARGFGGTYRLLVEVVVVMARGGGGTIAATKTSDLIRSTKYSSLNAEIRSNTTINKLIHPKINKISKKFKNNFC